jgi:hypothetical protein
VKLTETGQVPFAAAGPTQLFVCAKSPALTPETAIEEIGSHSPLTFVIVSVCGELVVPTVCAAKVRLDGLKLTGVPLTPLPLTASV